MYNIQKRKNLFDRNSKNLVSITREKIANNACVETHLYKVVSLQQIQFQT